MIRREDVYKIGQITKTHGLKGEVVFNFVDDIFDKVDIEYLICDMDSILVPFFMEEYRFRSDTSALVKFEGINSSDEALRLRGVDVYFESKHATEADEDEMSLYYFIGFSMLDADGEVIGEITAIDDNTDNWLFVVERDNGDEVLIPAHEEFIADLRHDEKVVVVDLPEGLLDL